MKTLLTGSFQQVQQNGNRYPDNFLVQLYYNPEVKQLLIPIESEDKIDVVVFNQAQSYDLKTYMNQFGLDDPELIFFEGPVGIPGSISFTRVGIGIYRLEFIPFEPGVVLEVYCNCITANKRGAMAKWEKDSDNVYIVETSELTDTGGGVYAFIKADDCLTEGILNLSIKIPGTY